MTTADDGGLAAVLLKLIDFSARLAALEKKPETCEVAPSIHWWSVKDDERAKAIERLTGWVEQVFKPHYGHLAVTLGDCWPRHNLVLVQLDWLSELHGVLYFSDRTQAILAAQAEYGTRIVPAVSEQFRKETGECEHRSSSAGANGWKAGR